MSETPTQPVKKRETVGITYATTPRSWRRRLATELRSWSRSTFNRESYMSSLRSLLWVVPLTVLIWVYAEREQVTTLANVAITVEPPPGQPGRLIVRFPADATHTIHAEVHGPQAAAEQMKELLESTSIALDLEGNMTPGEQQIDVAKSLNRDPRVISRGMEIQKCVPPYVKVIVDAIVESDADVRARPQDVSGLRPPVFTPASVKVRAPQADIDAARRDGKLFVYANLSLFKQALSEVGPQVVQNVPLVPAFDAPPAAVTIAPAVVEAHVEVPKPGASYTIPAMSVWAAYPKTHQSDEYKADYLPIYNVKVVGPDDMIAAIKNEKFVPHATFDVNFDDINAPRPAPLTYVLPPGVRVSEEDARRTIPYTFKPRNPSDK